MIRHVVVLAVLLSIGACYGLNDAKEPGNLAILLAGIAMGLGPIGEFFNWLEARARGRRQEPRS